MAGLRPSARSVALGGARVEPDGDGREHDGEHAEHDERKIEAHDEAVVAVDARHELLTEGAQRDEREQILGRDRDIRDLARDGGTARNGDARVASDRAGESFTPSPIMMTLRPAAFSFSTKLALSSGSTSE